MTQTPDVRAMKPFLPATAAADWGLADLVVGSPESRAAARALVNARRKGEELARDPWSDGPRVPVNLAELIRGVRERHEEAERRGEPCTRNLSPRFIPPGKEETRLGRFYARLNAANARVIALETERKGTESHA